MLDEKNVLSGARLQVLFSSGSSVLLATTQVVLSSTCTVITKANDCKNVTKFTFIIKPHFKRET